MVCNIRTYTRLLALCLLICSCSGDCCIPDECTLHGHGKTITIEAILPESKQAESFHLVFNGKEYNSTGKYFYVERTNKPVSLLLFNNDGESNIIKSEGNAYTHYRYDNNSLSYEPSPLYAYAVRDTIISSDTDTLRLYLEPRVCQYNLLAELINNENENKVTDCQQVILNGMARGVNLWSNQRERTTSIEVHSSFADNRITGAVYCWGKSEGSTSLTFAFMQGRHPCWFNQDISIIIDSIPFGGDIHLKIDVATQLDSIPPTTGGISIGVGDWNNEDTELTI